MFYNAYADLSGRARGDFQLRLPVIDDRRASERAGRLFIQPVGAETFSRFAGYFGTVERAFLRLKRWQLVNV